MRFVLPEPPASAVVLGSLQEWTDGLRRAGIGVTDVAEGSRPDLVVASNAEAALATGAPMALVEGRGARRILARAYPAVERYLPIPTLGAPHLILPLSHHHAADYAVRTWSIPRGLGGRARNRVARWLLGRGVLPELRPLVTAGAVRLGSPFMVRAAHPLGVPEHCEWFLTLGSGDPLTRGVFHLFPPGGDEPGWALKFARVPGYLEPFDRDERGLAVARAAGGAVARHAPRLLGRIEVAGLAAGVETAAVGARLTNLLQSTSPRAEKVHAIDAVAGWTVEAALGTRASSDLLDRERRRLAEEVVPSWSDLAAPADLVERVGRVPAVLQHNDLGSWNVISRSAGEFVAVDWESARAEGLPLWDLVYFLTDAITHLDGASPVERRDGHNAPLFRGELESSRILFRWIREYVEALALPPESVAPLVTLCWMHHGLSGGRRRLAVDVHAPGDAPADELPDAERIARLWLTTPGLGAAWDAWHRL